MCRKNSGSILGDFSRNHPVTLELMTRLGHMAIVINTGHLGPNPSALLPVIINKSNCPQQLALTKLCPRKMRLHDQGDLGPML
jgi:hypothetical protein